MKIQCCQKPATPVVVPLKASGKERRLIESLIASMDLPTATIREIAVGSHFVGIQAETDGTISSGLAATLGHRPTDFEQTRVGSLIGSDLQSAAQLLLKESGFSIALGLAALNAGITPPVSPPHTDAASVMAAKGRDKEVVLVGNFPFAGWLREQVGRLHLLELQDLPERTPPEQWDAVLGRCHVLGLTGTTLLTRAMATFLSKAPQAFTVVIGPSTPLSPILFDHGVDVLAGCRIEKVEPVFAGIRQGLSFRQFKQMGVRFLAWAKSS